MNDIINYIKKNFEITKEWEANNLKHFYFVSIESKLRGITYHFSVDNKDSFYCLSYSGDKEMKYETILITSYNKKVILEMMEDF